MRLSYITKSHRSAFCSYLADSLWLGDLGSIPVGHQGVENEQEPLQLLCCLARLFSFRLHDTQDLLHADLYVGTQPHQTQGKGSKKD